ncbi:hypothetical protein L1887_19491 [Cichorium endivia]|nr:hypothetical protein L1887_19491 [Cichorium endivia]
MLLMRLFLAISIRRVDVIRDHQKGVKSYALWFKSGEVRNMDKVVLDKPALSDGEVDSSDDALVGSNTMNYESNREVGHLSGSDSEEGDASVGKISVEEVSVDPNFLNLVEVSQAPAVLLDHIEVVAPASAMVAACEVNATLEEGSLSATVTSKGGGGRFLLGRW